MSIAGLPGGCAPATVNPAFPISAPTAETLLQEMDAHPVRLERPVVVIPGFMDVAGAGRSMARRLARLTEGDESAFVVVDLSGCLTFEACRSRVFEALNTHSRTHSRAHGCAIVDAPPPDGDTIEVDVVAYSMGGLVARAAALPGEARRLRVRRLFTIASPHQGAQLASREAVVPLVRDMAAGSAFLARLDAELEHACAELVPYVLLGDAVVGADRAAPRGGEVIWLQARPFTLPHLSAHRDPRILADIARRLRGEAALVVAGSEER